MDNSTRKYRVAEFNAVGTEYSEYKPKIKIIKPNAETKWLEITEAELQKIRDILTVRKEGQ